MLLEPLLELVGDDALDHRADLGGDQLVLGLRGEFRIRHLDREDRGQALAHVLAGELDLLLLGDAAFGGEFIDRARQRGAEPREVGAAVALRDVVGEAQHRLVIAVRPRHRDFDDDPLALAEHGDRGRVELLLGAVEVVHELDEAALVMHRHRLRLDTPRVGQAHDDAGIQEGELADAMLERGEVELDLGEGLGARQESDLGAGLLARALAARRQHWRGTDDGERRLGIAVVKADEMLGTVAEDSQVERRG